MDVEMIFEFLNYLAHLIAESTNGAGAYPHRVVSGFDPLINNPYLVLLPFAALFPPYIMGVWAIFYLRYDDYGWLGLVPFGFTMRSCFYSISLKMYEFRNKLFAKFKLSTN